MWIIIIWFQFTFSNLTIDFLSILMFCYFVCRSGLYVLRCTCRIKFKASVRLRWLARFLAWLKKTCVLVVFWICNICLHCYGNVFWIRADVLLPHSSEVYSVYSVNMTTYSAINLQSVVFVVITAVIGQFALHYDNRKSNSVYVNFMCQKMIEWTRF